MPIFHRQDEVDLYYETHGSGSMNVLMVMGFAGTLQHYGLETRSRNELTMSDGYFGG